MQVRTVKLAGFVTEEEIRLARNRVHARAAYLRDPGPARERARANRKPDRRRRQRADYFRAYYAINERRREYLRQKTREYRAKNNDERLSAKD